jgi:hypothetical protein
MHLVGRASIRNVRSIAKHITTFPAAARQHRRQHRNEAIDRIAGQVILPTERYSIAILGRSGRALASTLVVAQGRHRGEGEREQGIPGR